MCDPVSIAIGGLALSGVAEYKKTNEANANMKKMQDAKNNAFNQEMGRQRDYTSQGQTAFNTQINNSGAEKFKHLLADNSNRRLTAFTDAKLSAPTDYQFANTPKNVSIAQNKAFGDVDDKTLRDASNLANLSAYNDSLFDNTEYVRNFGNLADKAGRSLNLLPIDMEAAANNAYKPLNPWWSVASGTGKASAMLGAYNA